METMLSAVLSVLALAGGTELPLADPRPVRSRPAVRVVFGSVPCEQPVRFARVREGRRRVRITLVGQAVQPGTVCAESFQIGCAEVRLRRRLGRRRVVDGSGRRSGVDAATARDARAGRCPRVRVVLTG